jgi:hypothetical protein
MRNRRLLTHRGESGARSSHHSGPDETVIPTANADGSRHYNSPAFNDQLDRWLTKCDIRGADSRQIAGGDYAAS